MDKTVTRQKKTWKNLELWNKNHSKLEYLTIFIKSNGILTRYKKSIIYNNFYVSFKVLFVKKKTFKVVLQYLLNVIIVFKTISYIKFNFIPKINQKTYSSKS